MKHVVSVSIGSSKRDHRVVLVIGGEDIIVERIGTDGDLQKAIQLIEELDGTVDAFGMGGIDAYLAAGKNRYVIKDAVPMQDAAKKTPIVDGSGLKMSLEKELPGYIDRHVTRLSGKKVFIMPAIDRYGMAEGFRDLGCQLVMGDMMVALGINIPIKSLSALDKIASVIAPIACRLPFEMLYPTGKEQNKGASKAGRIDRFFYEADIIAGDFHYIRQYMPTGMHGKMMVTNTVTQEDIEWMRGTGVHTLVTSTPDLGGRSFGTNVIEALLVALSGKKDGGLQPSEYLELLKDVNFEPRVIYFEENRYKGKEKQAYMG